MTKHSVSLLVMTSMIGYKSQKETPVLVTYHWETVQSDFCAELLGHSFESVVIDSLVVKGQDALLNEFDGAVIHLTQLVREHLMFGNDAKWVGQVVFGSQSPALIHRRNCLKGVKI